jgi:asparagine synthetase B (glutamine-hydrolysing)
LIVDDPVKRVDNMTMAWGLEARVPFMDTQLVEHALSMPPSLKMAEEGKYPLKYISRGLLPDSVIDRKKGYFPMPALKYVRGEFLDFMSDILTRHRHIIYAFHRVINNQAGNISAKNLVHKFIRIGFGKFFIKPFLRVAA